MLAHVRVIVAAVAASTVVASALVGAAPTSAVTNSITLAISPPSVAPGDPLDLIASAPVAAAGSTTQEIVQQIDPTKVKLTSLSDIQYPAGWSLSYSFNNGGSWTATAPTSATGTATSWDKVTSVKATGNITSNGDDGNGYQVATGTSSGGATSLTPGSIPSSGAGDGYEAFFDPERTRVFNLYHHGGNNARVTDPLLDCHVIATGATCTGFPFVTNLPTGHKVTGRIVGTRLWFTTGSPYSLTGGNVFSGQPGFGCVDLSAVLASGGSPHMCSTSFVRMSAVSVPLDNFYFLGNEAAPGQTTVGVSQETRLWSMVNGKVVCLDTAAMAACDGMPANGWSVPRPIDSAGQYFSLDVIDGKIFYAGKGSTTGATKYMVGCVLASSPTTECSGWGATQVSATTGTIAPKLLDLPDANGNIIGVCGVSAEPWSACWTLAGAPLTKPATLPDAIAGWIHPMTMGSRVYMDNNVMWCWDAALNAGAGGVCYALAPLGNANYTAVPDPAIPLCVWSSKDIANTPLNANIQTWDISVSPPRAGCGQIAPVRASFSGGAVVPRMACTSSPGAIRAWRSFTLTGVTASAGAAYTATLTVMNRNGVNIPGWVRVPITENSALSLSSLDPSVTGISPTFNVDFTTTSGTVTAASAAVQVVGDAPELCLSPTAVVACPQALGTVNPSDLVSSSPAIVASGSVTAGGTTTQLTDDSRTLSISAPLMAQCAGTLIGRAGTATLGTSGEAIIGLTVTLLDSSGNIVLDGGGSPITTTTDSSGNYSFGNLTPANYKVRFPDTGQTATPIAAALSSVTVASGGTGTSAATCPTSWTFRASDATCSRTLTATTADVGAPTGVSLTYLVVGGGGGGAASSAKPSSSSLNASPSSGGDGGQVQSGTVTTTGAVGVTIGTGGAAGASGQASALSGGATVSAAGGSAGAASSPAGAGTTSSLSGASTTYGADGTNWSGVKNTSAGGAGTANRGNGGGAGWRRYEGAGCYEPGANHVYVNPGAPCGVGGTYENGGWWNTAEVAGAGGSGVVVLRYPVQVVSGAATVPAGGQAVVNALYIANPIARANSSSGKQGLAQTITPLADDTASTGATYSGGSTALKLCSTGQTSPNCTATTLSVSGEGTYTISGTNVTFTPCSASNVPAGIGCTGPFTGLATAVNYQSTDSAGQVATSTITPTVTAVPAAASDTSTGALNTSQTISVLTNDTAGTGTTLSASTVKICTSATVSAAACTSTTFSVAGQGTYTVNADGTVTFVPCQATGSSGATCTGPFAGTATAIKYVVSDALGQQSALATITPTVTTPTADVANADTTTGAVGVAQTVNPLTNDTAPTGVSLKATTVKLCTGVQVAPNCTGTSLVVTGKGVYTVNATTGVLTFTPCNATSGNLTVGGVAYVVGCTGTPFTGTPTAATYQVSDNLAATARTVSSTYTPTVVPLPSVTNDTSSGALNTVQTITPLGNDAAGTGTSLDASSVKICANSTVTASSCTGTSLNIAGQVLTFTPCNATSGNLTVTGVSYAVACTGTPFAGTPTAATYQVTDNLAATARTVSSTYTPAVAAAPSAATDTSTGAVNTLQTITPLSNDTAGAGTTFVASSVKLCPSGTSNASCNSTTLNVAGEGTYTVNANGTVSFAPCQATGSSGATCTGPFAGTATTIKYVVSDSLGQQTNSTITAAVTTPAVDIANADISTGAFGSAQTVDPLANDTSPTGVTLLPSTVKLCGASQSPPGCTATSFIDAGMGVYTVNPSTGELTFTPCNNVAGDLTISGVAYSAACTGTPFVGTPTAATYQVSDNLAPTARTVSATYTPTVSGPPPPSASAEVKAVLPGGTATFTTITGASGLAHMGTVDGPAFVTSATCLFTPGTSSCDADGIISIAGEGTFTLNSSTGVVTFVAENGVTAGALTAITYHVTDSFGATATSTLTPSVPVPPTMAPDTHSGAWDITQTISPLTNDAAASGATLVASSVKICLTSTADVACTSTTLDVTGEGTYTVNADGTVSFNPLPSFTGTATAIKYGVSDSVGQKAYSTITASVSAPLTPTAAPQTKPVIAGSSTTFTTLTGTGGLAQIGASNGPAFVTSSTCLYTPGTSSCDADGVVTIPGEGTYTLNQATGVVTFAAQGSLPTGSLSSITYRVADAMGGVATSTLTPTVVAAPSAGTDATSGAQGVVQTVDLLTNDVASTSATLVPSSAYLCDSGQSDTACKTAAVRTKTIAGVGTYSVSTAGVMTFTPEPSYTGTPSVLKYVMSDSAGFTTSSTYTPTVIPPPNATSDTTVGAQGVVQTVNLTSNDTAATGATLNAASVYLCDAGESDVVCKVTGAQSKSIAGVGTYAVDASGVMTFTPEPSFTGTPVALKYVVSDSVDNVASATYTPTVIGEPTALNDASTGAWNTAQSVNPLTNENSSLSGVARFLATTVKICAVATVGPCTGTSDVTTADGVYAVNPSTGVITFTPHASFIGVVTEPLKYTATDGVGQSASAQYTPTVSAPPAPSAAAELKQVLPGSSVAFTTLTDSAGLATSGGPAFVTSSTCLVIPGTNTCDPDDTVTIAGEGTFTLNQGTGIVTFVAAQAASPGTKTAITYQVVDATGASATNTLTPVIPEPPSAAGDASSAGWDVTQVITPLANDAAGLGESLVLSTLKLCASGQVPPACNASSVNVSGEGTYILNPNGSVSFDPLPTFTGSATPLRYQVSDLLGQTASATMTPYVTPPAAPSAKDDTEVVATGGTAVFVTITGAGGLAKSGGPAFDTSKTFLCDLGQTPPNCSATSVTVTGEGTFTLNQATGVVTYVAEPTASAGPMTPVQYVVVDRIGATAHATLTPVIPPLPTAAADTSLGEAGAVQSISPLGNDSVGANTAPFVAASLKLCGPAQSPPNCDHTTLVTADGTYVVKPLIGLIEFTPDPSFTSGAATAPVQYQATDSLGRVADATITPSVLPPPAPSAAVDRKTGKFGEQLTFRPLSNDAPGIAPDPVGGVEYTDPVFDTSTLRLCDAGEAPTACNATHVATADGEYDLDVATSVVTFTPHNGFTGTVTQPVTYQVSNSYTYTVSGTPNAGAQFGTSVIIPKILPPDPPSASDDDGDGSFGSPIVIDLIGNDTAGSFALDPRSIRFCAPSEQAPLCTATELVTADGTWTIDLTTGVATFTPGTGFTGTARVPYVIADTYGNVVEARANAAVRAASVKPTDPANTDVVVPETPSSPTTKPGRPAKKQQAPRRPLALPTHVGTGTTNILALNLTTNAGRRIRVSVTCLSGANALINLGEVAASCRTSTSHGVAKVWTSGKAPTVIRVVLWAPKKKGYTAFRLVKTYRVA